MRPARADKSYAYGGGEWVCPACGADVVNASSTPGRPFWHGAPARPGQRTGPHHCPTGRSPGADDPVYQPYLDDRGRPLPFEVQMKMRGNP